MGNKYLETYSTSSVVRGKQIKPTARCHFTSAGMVRIEMSILSVVEDVEKLELSCMLLGGKMVQGLWKTVWYLHKPNHGITT